MPSEMEFVNYKEFVESLPETESPDPADKSVISNPINGPRSVPGSAKDRTTTLTDFSEGDMDSAVFAIDWLARLALPSTCSYAN
mgnify:CR=1 FL=1